ncbi:MAG TPA: VanZ family protein [Longimicrobium sp.]|jgi:VanZ family protein|uniref:VanZ family protein n=1 Tax=Longimicrobium sp. TaxID=2029185 RepID=UPI002ED98285
MRRALAWLPAVAWAVAIYSVSGRSTVPIPSATGADKVLHFLAYAVLGGLLAFAAHRSALHPAVAVLLGVLYAATDEYHQSFVPGRSSDIRDWVADALGVCFAVYLYTRWRRRAADPSPDAAGRGAPSLRA